MFWQAGDWGYEAVLHHRKCVVLRQTHLRPELGLLLVERHIPAVPVDPSQPAPVGQIRSLAAGATRGGGSIFRHEVVGRVQTNELGPIGQKPVELATILAWIPHCKLLWLSLPRYAIAKCLWLSLRGWTVLGRCPQDSAINY